MVDTSPFPPELGKAAASAWLSCIKQRRLEGRLTRHQQLKSLLVFLPWYMARARGEVEVVTPDPPKDATWLCRCRASNRSSNTRCWNCKTGRTKGRIPR